MTLAQIAEKPMMVEMEQLISVRAESRQGCFARPVRRVQRISPSRPVESRP
jgi:hypothetical protein